MKAKSGQRKPARKTKARAPLQLRRLLVPVDFSGRSREALRYAIALAHQFQSRLVLVHVIEPMLGPAEMGYPPMTMQPLADDFRRAAKERLEQLCKEEVPDTLKADLKIRVGRPYLEITRAARDAKADLIILSTHGYTGLKHALLGSTAERVVRHAGCPVLTVR